MVHSFSVLGLDLAVDVNSGAVHVLDPMTREILEQVEGEKMPSAACPESVVKALPQYDPAEVAQAWEELYELQQRGELFAEDDYVDPLAAMPKNAPVKALCLHVAHDCNLRCQYCFAATGDFGTGHRRLMDLETAKRAIDFVIQKSGIRRNIEVDFFGGEPLMNMDVVKRTVEYARSVEEAAGKHFRFTITTNGLGLNDEIIEYINTEMSNVVLSLDGRPEVNDATRKTVSGEGSYAYIVPKLQKFRQSRGDQDYYVRGTFTRSNLDFATDVLHIADLGFDQISIEPVVGEEGAPYALREEDLPRICAEYERLAEEMLKRDDFNFFHFNVDLAQGPCVIKRLRGCGAGAEYVAVTPDGELYPCHQFVGMEDYRLGSVYDGSFDQELSDRFCGLNVYSREDCRSCWAKFYCSGGCSASNLLVNGDITKPHFVGCELERKRLECAIALKAKSLLNGNK